MKNSFIYIFFVFLLIILLFSQDVPAAEIRNPFMDYKLSNEFIDEEVTLEIMEKGIPFKLMGIISSTDDRIAIISTEGKTEFVKGFYEKGDYQILNIEDKRILIGYHNLRTYIEIGGDSNAANN